MELQHFLRKVESIFPLNSAIEYDKVGLQLDSGKKEVTRCLIAYEITDEVAAEAYSGGFDCIVAFHPLIFFPLQTISSDRRVGRVITNLIAAGIAVVVVHTNLDTHPRGTNMILAQMLGLSECIFMQSNPYHTDRGMGVIGKWSEPKSVKDAAALVAHQLKSRVRYAATDINQMISKVAIVAGSGYDFLDYAIKQGAEVLITADAKYHNFHAAKDTIALIEAGHQEMESHVPDILYSLLSEEIKDVDFHRSILNTNPIHYI
jgi:dinuclear metal center YbgI/SA1388 family protein